MAGLSTSTDVKPLAETAARLRTRRWLRLTLWAGVSLVLIPVLLQRRVTAKRLARSAPPAGAQQSDAALTARIQAIVEDIKLQLGVPDIVVASLVERNTRVVSVERRPDRRSEFTLQLEQDFVSTLPEDELRAVVAHELGHVWVATHHPYLQTEELANQIALRVVSRGTLELVYDKVWKRTGAQGAIAYLPAESPSR